MNIHGNISVQVESGMSKFASWQDIDSMNICMCICIRIRIICVYIICVYVYIYMYIYIYVYVYICKYIMCISYICI